MVKPNSNKPSLKPRKSRLDVLPTTTNYSGSARSDSHHSTTFIGFGAFATPTTADPSTVSAHQSPDPNHATTTTTSTTNTQMNSVLPSSEHNANYIWTPVYVGQDDTFRSLFSRIYQKRDTITLCKALQELQSYINEVSKNKKALVEAMKHYAYLYFTKLAIGLFTAGITGGSSNPDKVSESASSSSSATIMVSSSTLRAHAVQIWSVAYQHIPKAITLIISNHNEILGMIYATQTDPASEVRNAMMTSTTVATTSDPSCSLLHSIHGVSSSWFQCWHDGVVAFTSRILSYGRPTVLYEALCSGLTTLSPSVQQQARSKGTNSNTNGTLNEHQRDVMEELYIRLVGNCLDCIGQWLSMAQQKPSHSIINDPMTDDPKRTTASTTVITLDHFTIWFKPFMTSATTSSKQHSIRRKSYQLLSLLTMYAPYTISVASSTIHKIIPLALSTEKDAVNVPHLLETILSLLAYFNKHLPNQLEQQRVSQVDTHDAAITTTETTNTIDSANLVENDFAQSIVKPLTKLLQKACYGAKVNTWGPTILPMIGQYKLLPHQYQLLSSVVSGIPLTFGSNDPYNAWIAICESSSFILLRSLSSSPSYTFVHDESPSRNLVATTLNSDHDTTSLVQSVASLWIDGFQFLISSPTAVNRRQQRPTSSGNGGRNGTSAVKSISTQMLEGQELLLHNVVDQMVQFDQAIVEGRNCLFVKAANIDEWLWKNGMVFNSDTQNSILVQLLYELQIRKEAKAGQSVANRLLPPLKEHFFASLQQYQVSSSAVPSNENYHFFQAVIAYGGSQSVFDASTESSASDNSSLERFIMNDLLRWTIIHTTSLVTEEQHERSNLFVVQDFLLLSICFNDLSNNTKHSIWESFLREIIQAKCDLEHLVTGLSTLLQQQDDSVSDWLPCNVLDTFAAGICSQMNDREGTFFLAHGEHVDDESVDFLQEEDVSLTNMLEFYRVCIGLSSESAPSIVSTEVLFDWINYVCRYSSTADIELLPKTPSLLVALLETIQKERSILSIEQIDRILLASWYYVDQPYFANYSINLLNSDACLRDHFLSTASKHLRDSFNLFLNGTWTDKDMTNWAGQASLLFSFCNGGGSPMPLLGFEHVRKWQIHPAALFRLSMLLFEHVQDKSDRLRMVENWASSIDVSHFVVDLLIALSEASGDILLAAKCKDRKDRCAEFLDAIGGHTMDVSLIDRLVHASIEKLRIELKEQSPLDDFVRPQVAVMSQLFALMFAPVISNNLPVDELVTDEIAAGDQVWYISDPNKPGIREKAEVVNVHFDSQTGHYFSITVCRNGQHHERQTVVERLRRNQQITELSSVKGQEPQRKNLRDRVWNELLAPYLTFSPLASFGELVYITAVQIGLGDERGIGSVHYEIIRFIHELEQKIFAAMEDIDCGNLENLLWTFSLSLGFGLNTPGLSSAMSEMWSISAPFIVRLLDFSKSNQVGEKPLLDCAVLGLLIVSGGSAQKIYDQDASLFEQYLTLLFHIAASVMNTTDNETFTGYNMLACRAILEGVNLGAMQPSIKLNFTSESALTNVIEDALFFAVRAFANGWNSETQESSNPAHFPPFQQLVHSGIKLPKISEFISEVSLRNAEALCSCLFMPSKRSLAFTLLESVAFRAKPLYPDDGQVVLAEETASCLKEWIEKLDDDEAAVVEEDVYIVAEWVPSHLMVEIEGWDGAGFEMGNNPTIIGRLLSWFCFLRFVDAAAPQHFRNRPAFVSYVGRCAAASSILNLGLLHNEIINDKKRIIVPTIDEVSDILGNGATPNISQLATLSLFRTVEVLPSLCKRWWEDDCPKVYSGTVLALVEKYVAPEILKRELDRMKTATSFGKMSVSASLVSREVTATYVQDDFTLKVVITLPAAFPFRSAVADCSKTLGVAQNRWKRWSLQITLMLNSQGGTLQDALMLWKDNVDKEFEGVEPCPVCYSVLHVKTHKLPTLECKTCHNRFHLECLSEWFRSSGKSLCVLCQQPWQGSRVQ
jgi:hypothetical protein